MSTHTRLIYNNLGNPSLEFNAVRHDGNCACCFFKIKDGYAVSEIKGVSFSRQKSFLSGDFLCVACMWMFNEPKKAHINLIAFGEKIVFPMISWDTATNERPNWFHTLSELAKMPMQTSVSGVLTVDPKPRLWPMSELVTRSNFGLYVHNQDYNVSEFMRLDLDKILMIAEYLIDLIALKFSKRTLYSGILKDTPRVKKDIARFVKIETELKKLRKNKEFIPALMIAGVKKC